MNKQKLKQVLKEIEYDPMEDDSIKSYLPDARIITYPDLSKYQTIEELIPNNKDYIILLYLIEGKNSGHWTTLYNDNDCINFFCSYGSTPSKPLEWITKEKRRELNEEIPYLDILLSKTKKDVIYNPIEYQDDEINRMSTCGRHCVFRILTLLRNNTSLPDYYRNMQRAKKQSGLTYDQIVSALITEL